jgi:hypothetical protein
METVSTGDTLRRQSSKQIFGSSIGQPSADPLTNPSDFGLLLFACAAGKNATKFAR